MNEEFETKTGAAHRFDDGRGGEFGLITVRTWALK